MRAFAPFFLLILAFLLFGCAGQQPSQQAPPLEQPQKEISHPVLPPQEQNNSTATNGNQADLPSAYFYHSQYCGYCLMIEPMVNETAKKYGGSVQLIRVDVFTSEGYAQFDAMARGRNLSNSSRVVPLIVFGSRILTGYLEINQSLDSLLASAPES